MAESIMSNILKKMEIFDRFVIGSAATHPDELGHIPHRLSREKLAREGVPLVPHRARLMTREDGETYDLLIGMDEANLRDMKRIVGEKNARKVRLLTEFSGEGREIADPWYTGDYDSTYEEIAKGCSALAAALAAAGKP